MKMKVAFALVVVVGFGLGLGACTQQDKAVVAAQLTPVATSPEVAVQLARTCQALKPTLDIASGASVPNSVSDVAVYPAAYCNELVATQTLPATTDASTPAWLDKTIKAVGLAAKVAGVVLPLVL